MVWQIKYKKIISSWQIMRHHRNLDNWIRIVALWTVREWWTSPLRSTTSRITVGTAFAIELGGCLRLLFFSSPREELRHPFPATFVRDAVYAAISGWLNKSSSYRGWRRYQGIYKVPVVGGWLPVHWRSDDSNRWYARRWCCCLIVTLTRRSFVPGTLLLLRIAPDGDLPVLFCDLLR